jgi:hypothetical protein
MYVEKAASVSHGKGPPHLKVLGGSLVERADFAAAMWSSIRLRNEFGGDWRE